MKKYSTTFHRVEKVLMAYRTVVHVIQNGLVSIVTAVGKTSSKQFNKFNTKSVAAKSIIRIATLSPSDGHTLSSSHSHTFFVTINQLKQTKMTIKLVKNLKVRQFEVICKPRGLTPMSFFLGYLSIFVEIEQFRTNGYYFTF